MSAGQTPEPRSAAYEAGRRYGEELLRAHPLTPEMTERLAAVLVRPRTDQTRRAS